MLAVVTGASSGIGASFVRKLAARHYDLLLVARREDRLRSLADEAAALYRVKTEVLVADLTDDAARESLAGRLRTQPGLGLLVNNAGFGTHGYFHETDVQSQESMHRLHVLATVSLSHAAISNYMAQPVAARRGIINVSSVAAFGRSPQNVSYCATKTWMNAFTEGLALELGGLRSSVTVQALCPGFTLSEFHDVVKMDRTRIPKSLWMTADYVVEQSLLGFDRGELFVIPGWRYRAIARFMKLMPDSVMRKISVAAVRRYRQRKKD